MRIFVALITALIVWAAPALAADKPMVGPAAPWVEAMAIPEPDPALKDRPVQLLLVNGQSRYGRDGNRDYYVEYATLVQTPQGLAGTGNLEFSWQPGISELIIHKVRIVRAGKVIDLIPADQAFTVLRRENNLEGAVLDGTLSAVLQPEGLTLGDIVNVAWTLRVKRMPAAPGAENLLSLVPGLAARRLRFRETWEEGVPMRWRATEALGKPRLRKKDGISELTLELENARGLEPPDDAPPRFNLPATLELSSYADWGEISRVMAPLYAQAQTLAPQSPLKAEIERIAAAAADPKLRAMAALRLVQEKIRYFALTMGEGGYVPATADETWKRRFGDCKGKTVTLLALLAGLGIEAEPVLVSNAFGDSLGERLPMMRLFDHVIVRARIAGRSYWLDGTRTGDRSLDALLSSPFGFGLPLRAAGAGLETLPLLPAAEPLSDVAIRYDASGGFDKLVPFTAELVFRGDLATVWRSALAAQGEAALSETLKSQVPALPNKELELKSVRSDDSTGDMHVSFAGKTRMDWKTGPGSSALRFQFDHSVVQWIPEFERGPGPAAATPFLLPFPVYLRLEEIVLLPRDGAGFSVDAKPLDETVAATRITRAARLEGGKAVAVSSFRRLARELPAAEAKAAGAALARLNESRAWLIAPPDYEMSEAERAALRTEVPRDSAEFVDRGYRLMGEVNFKAALADFDKAIELDPALARAHANRGVVLVHLGRLDEAETSLRRALELSDDDFVVHQGLGMLHLARDQPAEAVKALTRSIQLAPEKTFTIGARLNAHVQLGKLREALADADLILALEPEDEAALRQKARLHTVLGEADAAIAAQDRLLKLATDQVAALGGRGELLSRLGRKDEAAAAWRQALALIDSRLKATDDPDREILQRKVALLLLLRDYKAAVAVADAQLRRYPGSVTYLALRCHVRAEAAIELPLALKDCDDAIRFDSGAIEAFSARGLARLRLGQWDGAIADYNAALALDPRNSRALFARGVARLRKGEREAGERDLASARRRSFDVDADLRDSGVTP
ncbi:MAG: tetratricopeptide repeat protein [Allosphingosinicella sp.]